MIRVSALYKFCVCLFLKYMSFNENLYKGGPLCWVMKKWEFKQGGTIVLRDEKMRIYKGETIVFLLEKKIKLYMRVPLFDFYDHMGIYTKGVPLYFWKISCRKIWKTRGGVICKGGVSVGNRRWYIRSPWKSLSVEFFDDL